jgi:galactonate dehydratase
VPIATGERLYSRAGFRRVLDAGVAIVQPDVSHAAGITEVFRIGTQAEDYDAEIAPHCPLGPVALAASLQLAFALPNFYAQEQVLDPHLAPPEAFRLLLDPSVLQPADGRIPRLTGPGLGIDINEEAVRAAVDDGPLEPGSPVWHHPDGSFAEW